MRSIVVMGLSVLVGCGSPAGVRGPAEPVVHASPPPAADNEVETVCRRMIDAAAKCGADASGLTMPACRESFANEAGAKYLKSAGRCYVEQTECAPLVECLTASQETSGLRACHATNNLEPVGLPRAEWERRKGAGITTFRAARSTKAAPIEICGIAEAKDWLTTLRCDDGSQPVRTFDDANDARAGNVGEGGRCGSIIDRYVVLCPEARYQVFIDSYICPMPDR